MNDKDQRYLEIAVEVFARYGMRKTTMADIASAAGVSRQTLYASFANKEEILVATILYVGDRIVRDVTAAWRGVEGLSDKLDIFFDIAVLQLYDMIQASPDSDDMVTGFGEAGECAVAETAKAKRALLATAFAPMEAHLATLGATPQSMGDFVKMSTFGLMKTAESRDHLVALLATLKTVVLRTVEWPGR